jgi:hypothetical protein
VDGLKRREHLILKNDSLSDHYDYDDGMSPHKWYSHGTVENAKERKIEREVSK